MGMVSISIAGSFGRMNGSRSFSAMKHGHADAVAQAIEYLSREVLPAAIALDHKLHENGDKPAVGFGHELADAPRADIPLQPTAA